MEINWLLGVIPNDKQILEESWREWRESQREPERERDNQA